MLAAVVRWFAGTEFHGPVLLCCAACGEPPVPAEGLLLRWRGCLAQAPLALAPALLAAGATEVLVAHCADNHPDGEAPGSRASALGNDDAGTALARANTAPQHSTAPNSPTNPDSAAIDALCQSWQRLAPGLVRRLPTSPPHLPVSRPRLWWRRSDQVLDAAAVPVPRRVLLGGAVGLPFDVDGDAQALLLAALRALVQQGRAPDPAQALQGLPAAGRHLEACGCNLCGACVHACPEEALQLVLADSSAAATQGLVHDLAACRSCGECLRQCPTQVLHHAGRAELGALWVEPQEVLAAADSAPCERCGNRFVGVAASGAGSQSLCHLCASRLHSPFGGLPPQAEALLPADVVAKIRRAQRAASSQVRGER